MKLFKNLLFIAASVLHAVQPTAADAGRQCVYLAGHGITAATGAAATTLASSLKSAYSSIETRSQYSEAWSAMSTELPSDVYNSLEDNGLGRIETTAPPAWFTGLPQGAKNELLEEQPDIRSVVQRVLGTRTSEGGATQRTTSVIASGAAAAGLLGALALL